MNQHSETAIHKQKILNGVKVFKNLYQTEKEKLDLGRSNLLGTERNRVKTQLYFKCLREASGGDDGLQAEIANAIRKERSRAKKVTRSLDRINRAKMRTEEDQRIILKYYADLGGGNPKAGIEYAIAQEIIGPAEQRELQSLLSRLKVDNENPLTDDYGNSAEEGKKVFEEQEAKRKGDTDE